MKIQCNVCEVAEAAVLCCADEAALCCACDERVHAANKLASKHQRVPLANSSSQMPKCDICQDSVGYFFCLEDRALLCRNCDVAIHNANPYVSSHQRFLLTGVRVGPESSEPGSSSLMERSPSVDKVSDADVRSIPKRRAAIPVASQHDKAAPAETPVEVWTTGDCFQSRSPFTGGGYGPAAGSLSQWHMDDFLGLNEFNQNFSYMDQGSSKADSGKMGGSDSSSYLRASDDGLDPDERLGEVPDIGRSAPKISSPPTASGLYWPSTHQELADSSLSVPDVGCSSPQNSCHRRPSVTVIERVQYNGATNIRDQLGMMKGLEEP